MKKTFSAVMIVVGTVIGSGFASGKEIAVFFSRFGNISYLFILFAFFLFWGVIYLFFSFGEKLTRKISSSKIFSFLTVLVSLIFTSSMFAGAGNVLPENAVLKAFFSLFLIVLCLIIAKNGLSFLSGINNFIMPVTLLSMCIVLFSNLKFSFAVSAQSELGGLFFMLLYVILNFSISSIVIAKGGMNLSQKQKVWASFFASLTLSFFLLLTNFVLLSHPSAMAESMPLLALSSGVGEVLIKFVIFSGCLTTLFSLVLTSTDCLKQFHLSGFLRCFIAIILPFAISYLGFGAIVSYLYPFASVLGTLFLLILFLLPEKKTS